MSALMNCGTCCMLLSIWAIIQLVLMGILYYFEVPILFEDVEPKGYADYDDFIAKTKDNYYKVAVNCWIAAVGYLVTLLMSCGCIQKAKKTAKREALKLEDGEFVCTQSANPPEKEKKKNSKTKQ